MVVVHSLNLTMIAILVSTTKPRHLVETFWAAGVRFAPNGDPNLLKMVDHVMTYGLQITDEQHKKDMLAIVTRGVQTALKERWHNIRSAHRTAMKKEGE